MIPNVKFKKKDDYNTTLEGWELIFKHINCRDKVVWLPFYNDGSASIHLNKLGINHIHQNTDFFTTDVSFDYIIDNPPYSIKQSVIEHCLSLQKPFALLLPIDTIERKYMRDKNFTIIIPNKRYRFEEAQNTTPIFKVCWFCFGFDLPRQIIYEI